jgi:hypothetical protein
MAMDLSWRDFAAIWGAGLSSLIVLARFLQARPRFKTEPGKLPTSDQILRIVNPAKNMRLIRERFRVKVSGDGCEIGIFTGKSRVCDLGVPGTLLFAIKGEDEREVTIIFANNKSLNVNGRWIVCFTWHGDWLLPFPIPAFVYISTKRAAQLNTAI